MKNIGVVGLGSIGMRHAKNLQDAGHQVIAYDPDEKRAIEFMQYRHPDNKNLPATTATVDEALTGVDAVIVASPTDDHSFQILTTLVNIPMFVEKPIGASASDRIEVAAAIKHSKQPMMVGYNLRYHPCVIQARDWLNGNSVGKIHCANFTVGQFNQKPAYLRDGVILNWSHEIDLALHLLGPASVVSSATRLTGGADDLTDILLRHENDARSVVHLDYLCRPEIRQTIIAGEDGQIILDLVNRQAWLRGIDGDLRDHFRALDTWDDDYKEEIADFINLLDGKGLGFHCTGEQALQVLDICLEVRKQAGL